MQTLEHYLKTHYRPSTRKSLNNHIKRFLNHYPNQSQTINYQQVLDYIAHQRNRYDLHPKTLKHLLYAVKVYFNYLVETGQREDHPCSELQLKDKINKQIQVDNLYSQETLENFVETKPKHKSQAIENRNKIIVSLLIYQALTVKEIAELTTENIDLEKCEITIKSNRETTSKSPQNRILPLKAKQILLFYAYLEKDRLKLIKNNDENQLIIGKNGEKINGSSISQMINENRPKAEKLQPIKIRQSVIANLLKKENDTRIVQVFSGHRRTSTTIQYKQTELEILQNAVNQYHPIR